MQRRDQRLDIGARVIALNRDAHETPIIPLDHRNLDLEFVVQAAFQFVQIAGRQGQGRQLREPLRLIRRERRQSGQIADLLTRITHQFVAVTPHLRPVVIALKLNRRRDAEKRGDVACTRPFLLVDELRRARLLGLPAPTDDQRLDQCCILGGPTEMLRLLATSATYAVAAVKICPDSAGRVDWPGACAPSTIEMIPACRARSSGAIGKVMAVGEVMWLRTAHACVGDARQSRRSQRSADGIGTLTGCRIYAPCLAHRKPTSDRARRIRDRSRALRPRGEVRSLGRWC